MKHVFIDCSGLLKTLREHAKLIGYTTLSRKTLISRSHLYALLSDKGNPSFRNLLTIVRELGGSIELKMPSKENNA